MYRLVVGTILETHCCSCEHCGHRKVERFINSFIRADTPEEAAMKMLVAAKIEGYRVQWKESPLIGEPVSDAEAFALPQQKVTASSKVYS